MKLERHHSMVKASVTDMISGLTKTQYSILDNKENVSFSYLCPVTRQWLNFKATSIMGKAGGGIAVHLELDDKPHDEPEP